MYKKICLEDEDMPIMRRIDDIMDRLDKVCTSHGNLRYAKDYDPNISDDYIGGIFDFGKNFKLSISAHADADENIFIYDVLFHYFTPNEIYDEQLNGVLNRDKYLAHSIGNSINLTYRELAKTDTELNDIINKIMNALV